MTTTNYINNVKSFYDDLKKDQNGRYRSWEHCYSLFYKSIKEKPQNVDKDLLCLNLAFYLASWGMYRGSSFLLERDYKVHAEVINKIMEPKYFRLLGIEFAEFENEYIKSLFWELSNEIKKIYNDIRAKVVKDMGKDEVKASISDTLTTKVLMGTLGCIPAYDRFFIEGVKMIRKEGGPNISSQYGKRSLDGLIKFYKCNASTFEKTRKKMFADNERKIPYPQMKILDMCFWQMGRYGEANSDFK